MQLHIHARGMCFSLLLVPIYAEPRVERPSCEVPRNCSSGITKSISFGFPHRSHEIPSCITERLQGHQHRETNCPVAFSQLSPSDIRPRTVTCQWSLDQQSIGFQNLVCLGDPRTAASCRPSLVGSQDSKHRMDIFEATKTTLPHLSGQDIRIGSTAVLKNDLVEVPPHHNLVLTDELAVP